MRDLVSTFKQINMPLKSKLTENEIISLQKVEKERDDELLNLII